MNIFKWNFYNKFVRTVFFFPEVFCSGGLFMILTHMLSETSCTVCCGLRPQNKTSCKWILEYGVAGNSKWKVYILQTSKGFFPQQTIMKFVHRLPGLNPHCRSTKIPTYKTHYTSLNSHHVHKLCSYLFMPERKKEKRLFDNKQKEEKACIQGCLLFHWR